MKKNNFSMMLLFSLQLLTFTQALAQSKIKDGSVAGTSSLPVTEAILELESNSKGLLLPRVALSNVATAAPLSTHVAGITVYNTATAGDVSPGYYYNDGTKWVRLADARAADTSKDAWVDDPGAGNTMVKLGAKSDGTTRPDSLAFVIKDDGKTGIGNTNPSNRLHVTADADPLRLDNLQSGNPLSDSLLTVSATGVVKRQSPQKIVSQSAHAVGDLKYSFRTFDHNGWIGLNGRAVSTLSVLQQANAGSLGFTTNLPDAANTYLSQEAGGAPGTVFSANNLTLAQNQLPDVTLSGTTDIAGVHAHDYTDRGIGATTVAAGTGSPVEDDGFINRTTNSTGAHQHTFTTSSVNGGVTQVPIDKRPQTLRANLFIYLQE